MASSSNIEWTDATWPLVTGCDPVSPGCLNCYAVTMTHRLEAMGHEKYTGLTVLNQGKRHFNGTVRCHEDALDMPQHWRKPRMVFVCSMSDLFHPKVPRSFIIDTLRVIEDCPQHTFQVLTKRPERMADIFGGSSGAGWFAPPLQNLWLGVTCEDQQRVDERIPHLLCCPAAVWWVSLEPMLGPITLPPEFLRLGSQAWCVCGGESSRWERSKARPMHPDWPRGVRDQCAASGVPFLFKQWGEWAAVTGEVRRGDLAVQYNGRVWPADDRERNVGDDEVIMRCVGKKRAGRRLDGEVHDAFPQIGGAG